MMSTYDPADEFEKIEKALQKLQKLVSIDHVRLLVSSEFGLHCQRLVDRLSRYLEDLPPPKPTPPTTEYTCTTIEDRLIDAPQPSIWTLWSAPQGEVDVHGKMVERCMPERIVQLPDPMFPGSPEREFEVDIMVDVAVKHALPSFNDDENQPKSQPERFEFQIVTQSQRYKITVPAVPPDAPLTPIQEEFIARRKELAEEVRDLTTYIQERSQEIGHLHRSTSQLVSTSEDLVRRVDDLPDPPDLAAKFESAAEEIEALRQQIPGRYQELENQEKDLNDLIESIKVSCPELQL